MALAIQVGTNYANDYQDGVRGTDDVRVGPMRLVASGLAAASPVRTAALASFGVAASSGSCWPSPSGWQLLLVGALSFAAGWLYTGGPKPYGYLGLGEVFVFVFFGLVATVGSAYVSTERDHGAGGRAPRCPSASWPRPCWWSTTCGTSRPTPTPASGPWPCASATGRPGSCT